jgi:high-affinity iron transporter
VTTKNLIFIGCLAITLVFLLSQYMEKTSQLFDGKGTELVFSLSFILIYLCSALLFLFDTQDNFMKVKKYLALVVFLLVFSLHGSHFILYISSYWAHSLQFESLFIGMILGVGICDSFAILLYFLLRYLDAFIYPKVSCYFLLFFAIGQLMQSIVLLQQVDTLPLSGIIWNSTNLVAEKSELGQLLQVLFGYEATPSYMQLIIYLIAFIVPVFISERRYIVRLAYGEKS